MIFNNMSNIVAKPLGVLYFLYNKKPPPPYCTWNSLVDILNYYYFYWRNIVLFNKIKEGLTNISKLFINISFKEMVG